MFHILIVERNFESSLLTAHLKLTFNEEANIPLRRLKKESCKKNYGLKGDNENIKLEMHDRTYDGILFILNSKTIMKKWL